MSRRRRLGLVFFVSVAVVAGLLAYARWIEPNRITVSDVTLELPGLDPRLESLNVVFLSDIQVERPGVRERKLVQRLRDLDPDLILIGGDFANVPYYAVDYVRQATAACSILAEVPARYGTIAVWGNNDLPEFISPLARDIGIRVLRNEWVRLDLPGGSLTVAGLDDPVTGRADWDSLLTPAPSGPMLVLAHSPDAFAEGARRGVSALLCGHTHGGQVWNPLIGLFPRQFLRLKPGTKAYRAGLYREGASVLYVSRGIGTSYFDFRFMVPPEITRVHLKTGG